MTPKLYKAGEVCDMAQLQPYVLRSWEKEFPGIGVQKSPDSPRLYRQSDVDQVLRIKQLVFGEGLTLAGARRRLDEGAVSRPVSDTEVREVLSALASDARTRIANVRDGLHAILNLLSRAPGTVVLVDEEYHLEPPAPRASGSKTRPIPMRPKAADAAAPAKATRQIKRGKRVSA